MTVTRFSRSPFTMANSRSISPSEMAAVGSSMMMRSDSAATALAISTICFWATESVETRWRGVMDGSRLFITLTMRLILSVRRRKPSVVSSIPRVRFSATVSWSTTLSSWNSVLMPFCLASRGLRGAYSWPLRRMRPPVRATAPVRILMRVDLPAPFSPTRQCTVFRRTSKETSFTARTLEKSFTSPRISRTLSVCSMAVLRCFLP